MICTEGAVYGVDIGRRRMISTEEQNYRQKRDDINRRTKLSTEEREYQQKNKNISRWLGMSYVKKQNSINKGNRRGADYH